MKSFACRDVGMDCDWTTTGNDDQDIMNKASDHAHSAHGIKDIPKELLEKAKSAIRDFKAA